MLIKLTQGRIQMTVISKLILKTLTSKNSLGTMKYVRHITGYVPLFRGHLFGHNQICVLLEIHLFGQKRLWVLFWRHLSGYNQICVSFF